MGGFAAGHLACVAEVSTPGTLPPVAAMLALLLPALSTGIWLAPAIRAACRRGQALILAEMVPGRGL